MRWRLLGIVNRLDLPDCWIGAGFVRNLVWDHLHGRASSPLTGDVDVIWYDPLCMTPSEDRKLEATLRTAEPDIVWSVKNQARMHERNGDDPYLSATDAMRFWPETATAIAARRSNGDECEVAAPLGFDDLMALVLRPTPRFADDKRREYESRLLSKGWIHTWPLLQTQG
ncbi:nucleotidyltransferase family protein [Acetobacter orleanensis]|nr:nucleotidyltransferase family protein [Acetobacter orleanensis]